MLAYLNLMIWSHHIFNSCSDNEEEIVVVRRHCHR